MYNESIYENKTTQYKPYLRVKSYNFIRVD